MSSALLQHHHNMFSTTTPPPEFEDSTTCSMLDISYPPHDFSCLSPVSLHRSASQASSVSTSFSTQDDMSYPTSEEAVQHMYFEATTSASPFYVPAYSHPVGLGATGAAAFSHNSSEAFPEYDQQRWAPMPLYSQTPLLTNYATAVPPTSLFPAYDAMMTGSTTNIIPPTPQDPASFDFNAAPMISNGYLTSSPQIAHAGLLSGSNSTPHSRSNSTASLSSLSRSCSPSHSHYSGIASPAAHRPLNMQRSSTVSSNSSTQNLHAFGIPISVPALGAAAVTAGADANNATTWRCAYPGCSSRAVFTRGCDLRKHYNRHSKHFFCRVEGCPQSEAAANERELHNASGSDINGHRRSISANSAGGLISRTSTPPLPSGGFSSKKDRARHEAKHNPGIRCEWVGPEGEECGRVFSRVDNMKDHVRRIHRTPIAR